MALFVSFDKAAKLLARQAFGVVDNDTQGYADDALELALQDVEQETHLISQEGDATLALTGANQYTLTEIEMDILRVVKAWTSWGPLKVIRKAAFVEKYPDFASFATGIPRHVVLWGDDSIYVWPDQADQTLNLTYYKLMEREMGSRVMSKLLDIARKYVEADPNVRGVNRVLAREALQNLNKAQTRATDSPVQLFPEQRVNTINHYKRTRGR